MIIPTSTARNSSNRPNNQRHLKLPPRDEEKAFSEIRVGDVVSCYFPLDENPIKRGPKKRPSLVVAVYPDHLAVAYGTTRKLLKRSSRDRLVAGEGDLREAGLCSPTRFDARRVRILPKTFGFFQANRHNVVKLGEVSGVRPLPLKEVLTAAYTH